MQVSETTKQEMRELALLYEECLTAASTIPTTTICEELGTRITTGLDQFSLNREDYRQIATSIFIEHNRQAGRKRGQERSQGRADTELSTENQQKYIGGLAAKGGKKAEKIITQFLDNNETDLVDKLSKAQATTLINMLKDAS